MGGGGEGRINSGKGWGGNNELMRLFFDIYDTNQPLYKEELRSLHGYKCPKNYPLQQAIITVI